MSSGSVLKNVSATICDICCKEIVYYNDTHASVNIVNVNDNPNNKRDVNGNTQHIYWWRKRKISFGNDSYDFHGDCFVTMVEKIKGNK